MSKKRYSMLIVDDSAFFRKQIRTLLDKLPLDIYEAADGNEAIEVLKSVSIKLVTLDIEMPGLNGFETLEKISQLAGSGEINSERFSVVFLTSRNSIEERVKGRGADTVLSSEPRDISLTLNTGLLEHNTQRIHSPSGSLRKRVANSCPVN